MARLLLRLRLRLLGNALQRSLQTMLGLILGGLFGLVVAVQAVALLTASAHIDEWPDVVTVLFAVVWLGWLILPALTFASDDTLDPRRFALFDLRPAELVPGLLLAALVGVGGLATALGLTGAVAGVGVRTGAFGPTAIAAVAVVLGVVASVAWSRAVLALASDVLSSRRGRDVLGAFAALLVVGMALAGQAAGALSASSVDLRWLASAADVLAWTPGGMGGAAVAAAAEGAPGVAVLWLLGAAASIAVALALWTVAIRRVQVVAPTRTAAHGGRGGLYPRWLDWLPRTRTTAVAARFLRTLARDGRVRNQAFSQAVVVVPLVVLSAQWLDRTSAPLAAVAAVVPFGLLASNQFGLDGPALWQHEVAGSDPRSDLLGRALALGFLGLAAAVVGAAAVAVVFGDWTLVPAAILESVAVLLTLLGVSSGAAALAPYPIPEEPSNVFGSTSSGAGCVSGFYAMAVLAANGAVTLPVVLLVSLLSSPVARTMAALAGVAYGALALVGGVALGTSVARSRGPDLLRAVDPRRM